MRSSIASPPTPLERGALRVELARTFDRVLQPRPAFRRALVRLHVGGVHLLGFLQQHRRIVAQLVECLELLRQPHQQHRGRADHQLREADAGFLRRRIPELRLGHVRIGVDDGERFALEGDREREGRGRRAAERHAAAVHEIDASQVRDRSRRWRRA